MFTPGESGGHDSATPGRGAGRTPAAALAGTATGGAAAGVLAATGGPTVPDALETAATCASEVDEAEPMLARGLALLGEWSFTHRRSFLRKGQGRGAERRGKGTGGRGRAKGGGGKA